MCLSPGSRPFLLIVGACTVLLGGWFSILGYNCLVSPDPPSRCKIGVFGITLDRCARNQGFVLDTAPIGRCQVLNPYRRLYPWLGQSLFILGTCIFLLGGCLLILGYNCLVYPALFRMARPESGFCPCHGANCSLSISSSGLASLYMYQYSLDDFWGVYLPVGGGRLSIVDINGLVSPHTQGCMIRLYSPFVV